MDSGIRISRHAQLPDVETPHVNADIADITDAWVAAANKDGVAATASMRTLGLGAQQAAAGDHTHTLAEDVVGNAGCPLSSSSSGTYHNVSAIAADGNLSIATKTLTFAATSMAVAVAYVCGDSQYGEMKLQLVMGGVQVAESAYIISTSNWIVVGTRALSGEQACLARVHNYYTASASLRLAGYEEVTPSAAGIGVGSIKV